MTDTRHIRFRNLVLLALILPLLGLMPIGAITAGHGGHGGHAHGGFGNGQSGHLHAGFRHGHGGFGHSHAGHLHPGFRHGHGGFGHGHGGHVHGGFGNGHAGHLHPGFDHGHGGPDHGHAATIRGHSIAVHHGVPHHEALHHDTGPHHHTGHAHHVGFGYIYTPYHHYYLHGYGAYGYGHLYGYSVGYSGEYAGGEVEVEDYGEPAEPEEGEVGDDAKPDIDPGEETELDYSWSMLARGYPGRAQSAFARDAQAAPADGGPKIGYALSAALRGDDTTAVWAMRRAFRIDPEAARYMPPSDDRLEGRLDQLASYFRYRLQRYPEDPDARFMLASIRLLQHDEATAEDIIDHGDDLPSTRNLQGLLDDGR
ncbi:MAG: tetratricopeptide repeat protein [Acidobacteriota bacterium]